MSSLNRGPPDAFWRERIATSTFAMGLQDAMHDSASRSWVHHPPMGWTGKDFVRAVQLCRERASINLSQRARMQGRMRTERDLMSRAADHVVSKVATHYRRTGWVVEVEPRIYHRDRQLFVPNLAVHQLGDVITVCDVQVCWEGSPILGESWDRKRLVYDHQKFREAAYRRWHGKRIQVLPLLLGARGVWPRCNAPTIQALAIPLRVRA